jgi:hypothetical protein
VGIRAVSNRTYAIAEGWVSSPIVFVPPIEIVYDMSVVDVRAVGNNKPQRVSNLVVDCFLKEIL